MLNRISDTTAGTVIDVGAGEGTYAVLARHTRLDARWIGLEVHDPYIERFLLGQKYDVIVVDDIRTWRPDLIPGGYVILFGDVLEHMTKDEAVDVLRWHMERADEIMVSVPIVYSPQGAVYGNDHETHHHQYHWEEMDELLPGAESWKGHTVGRWWWKKDPTG